MQEHRCRRTRLEDSGGRVLCPLTGEDMLVSGLTCARCLELEMLHSKWSCLEKGTAIGQRKQKIPADERHAALKDLRKIVAGKRLPESNEEETLNQATLITVPHPHPSPDSSADPMVQLPPDSPALPSRGRSLLPYFCVYFIRR